MAGMVIRKASRQKAFLKLGIASPSGGGKTMGALLIAYGLMKEKYPALSVKERWAKIVIIDSENGSGELYVGTHVNHANITIGEYAALSLDAPYAPERYTQAIKLAHDNEFEVVIIDSMTHMWTGVGGALDKQGREASRTGNSWTAWRKVTPEINTLIDAILQTPIHVIATMRSKTQHAQEKNSAGKTVIKKLGTNPIIREGMEYEFTIFFEINIDHETFCSKDRTNIFDGRYFKITPDIGKEAMQWLEKGTDDVGEEIARAKSVLNVDDEIQSLRVKSIDLAKELGGQKSESLMALIGKYTDSGNPNKIKNVEDLKALVAGQEKLKQEKENK